MIEHRPILPFRVWGRYLPFLVLVVLATKSASALGGYVVATGGSVTGTPDVVGTAGDLVRITCATQQSTILRTGPLDCPCFSPDGKKIAFVQNGYISTINSLDGSGIFQVVAQGGTRATMLNWTPDNYIYWSPSNDNKKIYRVPATGGQPALVYTLTNPAWSFGDHLKMSRDGTRAAWWCMGPNYQNPLLAADLPTHTERYYGIGCMTSFSPSGLYLCHNTPNHRTAAGDSVPAHVEAYLRRFEDTVTTPPVRIVTEPASYPNGYFNRHRFSQNSDTFIVFYTTPRKAWVCNVWTNYSVNVGNGLPMDYYPSELGAPAFPAFALSSDTIDFDATLGQASALPTRIDISIVNETPAIPLQQATVEEDLPWLQTVVQGTTIGNTIDLTTVTQAGPLSGTVAVRVPNAYPPMRIYTVRLSVRSPGTQTLTSIVVTPQTVSVQEDQTVRFTAVAEDQNGNPLAASPAFTWRASGGGSIDSQGVFRPSVREGGPFDVTATAGGVSGTAKVTVVARPVRVISPNGGERFSIGQSMSIQFDADTSRIRAVVVEVSVDEGLSWVKIVMNAINYSSQGWPPYTWPIPDTLNDLVGKTKYSSASSRCLVRIADYNPTGLADQSDATFTIVNTIGIRGTGPSREQRETGFCLTPGRRIGLRIVASDDWSFLLSNTHGQSVLELRGRGPAARTFAPGPVAPGVYAARFCSGTVEISRAVLIQSATQFSY